MLILSHKNNNYIFILSLLDKFKFNNKMRLQNNNLKFKCDYIYLNTMLKGDIK